MLQSRVMVANNMETKTNTCPNEKDIEMGRVRVRKDLELMTE